MDGPLETHLGPIWQQFPGSVCWWAGAGGTDLWRSINDRNASGTVKSPIHGFDARTNFRSKKCSLVWLMQTLGTKATTLANFIAPWRLRITTGPHQMAYRQLHQDYRLALCDANIQRRILGSSADLCSDLQTSQQRWSQWCLRLSIPSSIKIYQCLYSCLTRTRRSSHELTTTSRPYETVMQPGWCLMQPQRGNAIWRAKVVQYLHSALPTREGFLPTSQNTVSTPVCQYRLLEQTHVSDLSWDRCQTGFRWGSHCRWITHYCITRSDRVCPAMEYLHELFLHNPLRGLRLLIFTRHFIRTSGLFPSTFTTPELGSSKSWKEGRSCWVLHADTSRASFRRIPGNGKSYFTMMSLHIPNQCAKKRGIAKNLLLAVRTRCGWRYCPSFLLHWLLFFAHAFVCLMFPVFSAWHFVIQLLSVVATWIPWPRWRLAFAQASRACCFCFVFPFVLLSRNVPCDFWQHARNLSLRCGRMKVLLPS